MTALCDEFDVILGNLFLAAHKAVLDYGCRCISITRDCRNFSWKASLQQCDTKVADTVKSIAAERLGSSKLTLNCAQAARYVRNGCESFFVLVNNDDADRTIGANAVIDDDDDDDDECTGSRCTT